MEGTQIKFAGLINLAKTVSKERACTKVLHSVGCDAGDLSNLWLKAHEASNCELVNNLKI